MVGKVTEEDLIKHLKRESCFEDIKKDLIDQFRQSTRCAHLEAEIEEIVTRQTEKDPTLVARDKGRAMLILGEAVKDNGVLTSMSRYIDRSIEDSRVQRRVERILTALADEISQADGT